VVDIIVRQASGILRENPHCANPRVLVQNRTGKQKITRLNLIMAKQITYSSNFQVERTVRALDKTEIELPFYWGAGPEITGSGFLFLS
jgi:hypothetical protein